MSKKNLMAIQTDEELDNATNRACEKAESSLKDEQDNHPNPLADQLIKACQEGNIEDVKELLEIGARPNCVRVAGTPACGAVSSPYPVEVLEVLITAGANLNLQDELGWSPLFIAAGNDLAKVIEFLIKSGADINAQCSSNGWTALMNAACFGYVQSTVVLLALGADVTIKSEDGITALEIAKANNRTQTIQIFHKYVGILSRR